MNDFGTSQSFERFCLELEVKLRGLTDNLQNFSYSWQNILKSSENMNSFSKLAHIGVGKKMKEVVRNANITFLQFFFKIKYFYFYFSRKWDKKRIVYFMFSLRISENIHSDILYRTLQRGRVGSYACGP